MEAVKCRKTNIIVLLLSFGFLFLASCAFGQVERMVEDGVTKRYTSNSLCFKSPLMGGDTIFFNLMSDSLDEKTITFNAYVYYPSNIKVGEESIVIGYSNGRTSLFQKYSKATENNCVVYELIGDINDFAKNKVSFVLFRGIAKYDKVDKNYFSDFFKNL